LRSPSPSPDIAQAVNTKPAFNQPAVGFFSDLRRHIVVGDELRTQSKTESRQDKRPRNERRLHEVYRYDVEGGRQPALLGDKVQSGGTGHAATLPPRFGARWGHQCIVLIPRGHHRRTGGGPDALGETGLADEVSVDQALESVERASAGGRGGKASVGGASCRCERRLRREVTTGRRRCRPKRCRLRGPG